MIPFAPRLYLTLFRLAFRDAGSPRRRRFLRILAFAVPAWALFNAVCLALDHLFYPGFRRIRVGAPIFLVGHARSGTTLLHRLLAEDPQFSWFATWELFLPALVQRRMVDAVAWIDRRLLGGRIERRLRAWEERTFRAGRGMHEIRIDGPEEDEFLLMLPGWSPTWSLFFPYMRELQPLYFVDRLPARQRRRILRYYRGCVQRQLYRRGAGKVHLSKNPTFAGKMEALLDTFPDARFVALYRDPREAVPSLLKLMKRTWRALDCSGERLQDSLRCLTEQSFHTYRYPEEVLARHPSTPRCIVDYRELVRSPATVVRRVYGELGLELTKEQHERIEMLAKRPPRHAPDHHYGLEEFGLSQEELQSRLPDLFERFAWDRAE